MTASMHPWCPIATATDQPCSQWLLTCASSCCLTLSWCACCCQTAVGVLQVTAQPHMLTPQQEAPGSCGSGLTRLKSWGLSLRSAAAASTSTTAAGPQQSSVQGRHSQHPGGVVHVSLVSVTAELCLLAGVHLWDVDVCVLYMLRSFTLQPCLPAGYHTALC